MAILLPKNSVEIVRGSSKTLKLKVTDGDGNIVNLTGATVYFTVKKSVKDEHALISKSSSNISEIEVANPTDGTALIYLIPQDTSSLGITNYTFDVWVVLASGERFVVVQPSVFKVTAGVTNLP